MHPNYSKHRPSDPRLHKGSVVQRDYEDEQDCYQIRQGDSVELRELKGKVRTLVGKVGAGKKEREQLQREN